MSLARKLGLAGTGTSLVVAGALLVGGSAGAASLKPNSPSTPNHEGPATPVVANSSGTAFGSASIACPAGTVVTGGGGRTSGRALFFTDSYKDGNGWTVIGTNTATSGSIDLWAVAVCASTG